MRMAGFILRSLLLLLGFISALVAADREIDAPVLFLRAGTIDTSSSIDPSGVAGVSVGVPRLVVQLDGPMNDERRAALTHLGVVLGDYLSPNGYIVEQKQADAFALAALPFVHWISPFRNEWKLDPDLGRRNLITAARQQLAARGLMKVVITLFEGEPLAGAMNEIRAAGATILSSSPVGRQWVVDAAIAPGAAPNLAAISVVQFVEEAPEGVLRNDTNEWIVQSNISGKTPVWAAGIHGEGQIGGLIDSTIKESHCAFDDSVPVGPTHRKILAMRNAGSVDLHGTHVADTFAGDRGTYGVGDQYDGMAFAAKLTFSNVDPIYASPSTLYARLLDAHNDGARVHSNSWGDDETTAYTTWCRQIDQYSFDHEEDLVAFAVTNLSSLTTPENAKNVLAVGASRDTPNQHLHCSGGAGPTADGRRKPEIYAPGCSTQSANFNTACGVTGLTGTSMACPAISGAALLARQYFTDGYYPTGTPTNPPLTPSGALLKAIVINGGADMTGISGYPSNLEGWGRLVLDDSLYFPGDSSKLYIADVRNANGLSTGSQTTYMLAVTGSSQPLRVTVVYTEPPASVNAGNPVINNLDLTVDAPGGMVYKGNVFSGGQSTTGGVSDAKNNVERVVLNVPDSGFYSITVHGTAVNQGTQGYALVVTGEISEDCNGNGVPDALDILNGTSLDCNLNNTPDDCEPDCDADGVPDECELAQCPLPDPSCADCNRNGLPDGCDLTAGTSADCNGNGAPDECDIAGGLSNDANNDGVPDECCAIAPASAADGGAYPKNRYVSFFPGDANMVFALRLTITTNPRFSGSVGLKQWVGPPNPVTGIARLQCTPHYRDWGPAPPVVHVGDVGIAPGVTFRVDALALGCPENNAASYSQPLTVSTTGLWCDIVGLFDGTTWTAPNSVVSFIDVQAVLQRFLGLPSAPALVRADVDGEVPNGAVNFADIQWVVRAFQGVPYPFGAPVPCPP